MVDKFLLEFGGAGSAVGEDAISTIPSQVSGIDYTWGY